MDIHDSLYLEHHGILGMKWGVRRERNSAGIIEGAGKDYANTKSRMSTIEKNKETKAKIKKGAAIAGALLATGVAIWAIQSGSAANLYRHGKALVPFDTKASATVAKKTAEKAVKTVSKSTPSKVTLDVIRANKQAKQVKSAGKVAARTFMKVPTKSAFKEVDMLQSITQDFIVNNNMLLSTLK